MIAENIRFIFSDILDTKVVSESCDDVPDPNNCVHPKGHIIVNGHQYSKETTGINVVVFDFRSSMLETRVSFDVYNSPSKRRDMASFLDALPAGKLLLMAARDAVGMNAVLSLALQRVGVSATFATTNLPKSRLSMASILYTGDRRFYWEKTINKLGGTGASEVARKLYVFRFLQGIDDCSEEMGIRTGRLTDDKITAQYVLNNKKETFGPHLARLHNTHSWCGGSTMSSDYIQVDLGSIKTISGVATQVFSGQRSILHNIQRFYISYSVDGKIWKEHRGYGSTRQEFVGNKNILDSVVVNWLARVQVRFLRITPTARYTDVSTHCLRMELFGCELRETTIADEVFNAESLQVTEHARGGLSFHGFASEMKNVTIKVSTAESNSSLANYIDQFHIHSVRENTISSNGTERRDSARITKISENILLMNSQLEMQYSSLESDHYQFALQLDFWVNKCILYLYVF